MKLPKGWHEVTIAKFAEYYTLSQSKIKDALDYEVRVISIFSGVSVQEIEKLKTSELVEIAKKLSFLKELPTTKIPITFKCGANKYKAIITMSDMTTGQFMAFNDILKNVKAEDSVYEMHRLIAAMCQKQRRGMFYENGQLSFNRYEWKNEGAEEIRTKLTMDKAYPLYVFFCNVMERLPNAIRSYLINETKKAMKWDSKSLKKIKHLESI